MAYSITVRTFIESLTIAIIIYYYYFVYNLLLLLVRCCNVENRMNYNC